MNFSGTVQKGAGRGTQLGFPTLNIHTQRKNIPEGVFAAVVMINQKHYQGVLHSGKRPTFQDSAHSIEIHLFDFSRNIVLNTAVDITILKPRLRAVQHFASVDALKTQIAKDCAAARLLLQEEGV